MAFTTEHAQICALKGFAAHVKRNDVINVKETLAFALVTNSTTVARLAQDILSYKRPRVLPRETAQAGIRTVRPAAFWHQGTTLAAEESAPIIFGNMHVPYTWKASHTPGTHPIFKYT